MWAAPDLNPLLTQGAPALPAVLKAGSRGAWGYLRSLQASQAHAGSAGVAAGIG